MYRAMIALAALVVPAIAQAGELVIQIDQIRSDQGQVRVALYENADRFLKPDGFLVAITRKSVVGALTVRFSDLAEGDYAVALFHDENGNGRLDSNLIGIPLEGTGFSRNGRGSFGPPEFSEVAVRIESGGVQTTPVRMSY